MSALPKRGPSLVSENETGKLEHLGRMAVLGEVAAGIAHELNTPLNVIQLLAEQVADEQPNLDPKNQHRLENIQKNVARMSALIQSVLSFSRPTSAGFTPVLLSDVIRTSVELIHDLLSSNQIKVELHLPVTKQLLVGNEAQLIQVFTNLLTNAKDAIKEAHGKAGGRIFIQTETTGALARICVTDNGIGVSKDKLKNVFKPFYTTKNTGEGTGLGLSISQNIIESHGGRIQIESESGRGTQVIVELPLLN